MGNLPDTRTESIAHIFGTRTSILEQFILKNSLNGPGWLKIKDPKPNEKQVSSLPPFHDLHPFIYFGSCSPSLIVLRHTIAAPRPTSGVCRHGVVPPFHVKRSCRGASLKWLLTPEKKLSIPFRGKPLFYQNAF